MKYNPLKIFIEPKTTSFPGKKYYTIKRPTVRIIGYIKREK